MGPIGYPEMVFIFILALLLFGPKKLPELGKTLGKALTEFNRAKNELKTTFDREMRSLERETESIKEATNLHYQDSYNYDYSSYDSDHHLTEGNELPAQPLPALSASATQGADEASAQSVTTPVAAPEGTIANGTIPNGSMGHEGYPATDFEPSSVHPAGEPTVEPAATIKS